MTNASSTSRRRMASCNRRLRSPWGSFQLSRTARRSKTSSSHPRDTLTGLLQRCLNSIGGRGELLPVLLPSIPWALRYELRLDRRALVRTMTLLLMISAHVTGRLLSKPYQTPYKAGPMASMLNFSAPPRNSRNILVREL
jgi:hypothetical protein